MKDNMSSMLKTDNFGSTIGNGAIIIAIASILSKFIGFFRDRLFTMNFGADRTLDIYYTAFKLPDFIFNILVLGALSSSFIPVFLSYWMAHGKQKEAWHITNSVLNILTLGLILFCVVGWIFASNIIHLLAPGFSYNEIGKCVEMTRIMLVGVVFFGLSNIASGVLNALRRFFVYSLAPIFYNIGIIVGIVFLFPRFGISGLAIGAVFGAALHFLVQLPSLYRVGYRYQFITNVSHEGVRKIGALMLPRTFGLGISQINQMVTNSIASTLSAGSIAVFNLAYNLQTLPVSIFSISLAISAFPVFSEAFIAKRNDQFVLHFGTTVRRILYFIIPSSIFILLLRAQLVRLVFGAGSFDWNDTKLTAQVLGFFSLSLFAQSLIPLLARSFYALCDSKTPVVVGFVFMIVNVALSLLLAPSLHIYGLALAFSITNVLNMLVLLIILRVRIGDLSDKKIVHSLMQIIIASIASALLARGVMEIVSKIVNMHTFLGIFWETMFAGITGCIVYFGLTYVWKMEEIMTVLQYLKKVKNLLFRKEI